MEVTTRIARGCYLNIPEPSLADKCAALLAGSAWESAVVGLAAAELHGLWLPDSTVVPQIAHCRPGVRSESLHRSRRREYSSYRWEIPAEHLTAIDGVPVTTLERTWWDLASRLSLGDLVAAGDRALHLGACPDAIAELIRGRVRRRGNARAREALPLLDARSRSRPESHLRVIVRQAGLNCFQVNQPVFGDVGGWLAEPDLACGRSRIALEYQGAEHASVQRMRADITRETDLRQHRWLVLNYGPAQVLSRPWLIGPELDRLHRRRLASLASTGHL